MREYVELNCLEEDGRLYHNNLLDTIEALIPNQFDSVHAADLLELPDGDLLACWFAGSDEGNADISIAVSRLKAGESRWSVGEIVSVRAESFSFFNTWRRNLVDVYGTDFPDTR